MADKLAALAIKDTGRAFKTVKALYPHLIPREGTACGIGYEIGRRVADAQPDYRALKLEPESIYCNYGFYHAYAREVLLKSNDLQQAKAFCEHVAVELGAVSSAAVEECFRSVGTALPFLRPDLSGDAVAMSTYALSQCESLAPEGDQQRACFSGVFNRIGLAQISGDWKLSVNEKDPMALCHMQPDKYVEQCEGNLKRVAVIPGLPHDLPVALSAIQKKYPALTDDDIRAVVFTIGYDSVAATIPHPDFQEIAASCLKEGDPNQSTCIGGAAVGIAKNGIPGEQDRQLHTFCNAVTVLKGTSSPACPGDGALKYLKGFFPHKKFARLCESFGISTGVCAVD